MENMESQIEQQEKFLNSLLPLMMGLRLVEELINKIHSGCSKPENAREFDKEFPKMLELHITNNYEQVIIISNI